MMFSCEGPDGLFWVLTNERDWNLIKPIRGLHEVSFDRLIGKILGCEELFEKNILEHRHYYYLYIQSISTLLTTYVVNS